MYKKIIDPKSGETVNIQSNTGKNIIKKYLENLIANRSYKQAGGRPHTATRIDELKNLLYLNIDTPKIDERIIKLKNNSNNYNLPAFNVWREQFNNQLQEAVYQKSILEKGFKLRFQRIARYDEICQKTSKNMVLPEKNFCEVEMVLTRIRLDDHIKLYAIPKIITSDDIDFTVYGRNFADLLFDGSWQAAGLDNLSIDDMNDLFKTLFLQNDAGIFPRKGVEFEISGSSILNCFKKGWFMSFEKSKAAGPIAQVKWEEEGGNKILSRWVAGMADWIQGGLWAGETLDECREKGIELFIKEKHFPEEGRGKEREIAEMCALVAWPLRFTVPWIDILMNVLDNNTSSSFRMSFINQNSQIWFFLTYKDIDDRRKYEARYSSSEPYTKSQEKIREVLGDRQNLSIDRGDEDKLHISYSKEHEAYTLYEFNRYIDTQINGLLLTNNSNTKFNGKYIYTWNPLHYIDSSDIDISLTEEIHWVEFKEVHLAGVANIVYYSKRDSYGNQLTIDDFIDYWTLNGIDDKIGNISNNLAYNIRISKSLFVGSSSTATKDGHRDNYYGITTSRKRGESKEFLLNNYTITDQLRKEQSVYCNPLSRHGQMPSLQDIDCVKKLYNIELDDLCTRGNVSDNHRLNPGALDDYPNRKYPYSQIMTYFKKDEVGQKSDELYYGYKLKESNPYSKTCAVTLSDSDFPQTLEAPPSPQSSQTAPTYLQVWDLARRRSFVEAEGGEEWLDPDR